MTLTATSSGTTYVLAPSGTHVSRCVQLIDLGHQWSDHYKKSSHKILIGWELCDEQDEEGKPFLVWRRYTLSTHEKSVLRQHLESWRGRTFTPDEVEAFDLKNIADKCCLISIIHSERDGSTYADVSSVMALPKGTTPSERRSDLVIFDIDDFRQDIFDEFSEKLQETINNSAERQKRNEQQEAAVDAHPANDDVPADDGDIPF